MSLRHVLIGLMLWMSTWASQAQVISRQIPAGAICTTMSMGQYPQIILNGIPRTLSPSARIWNDQNLIVVPTALQAPSYFVCYSEDSNHFILKVWILTAAEAKQVTFQ